MVPKPNQPFLFVVSALLFALLSVYHAVPGIVDEGQNLKNAIGDAPWPSSSLPSANGSAAARLGGAANHTATSAITNIHIINNINNNKKNDAPNIQNDTETTTSGLFLQPSDSLYKKYNISTTPYVIERYKLLLFTTEKIGSTVLKQLLRRMMNYTNYDYHGQGIPHVSPQNGLRVLTDYTINEANEMMVSDEWVRAMFVRDPKERALSGYLNALRGWRNQSYIAPNTRTLKKCCRDRALDEILCLNHIMRTFEAFLSMIEEPKVLMHTQHDNNNSNINSSDIDIDSKLRASPSCPDKHWSPKQHSLTPNDYWTNYTPKRGKRMECPGWGKHRNESMFESASTVKHSTKAEHHLLEHYTSREIENRVEELYGIDYDNEFLDLERVPIGEAQEFYRRRFMERFGTAAK
ncbi:hypothetical protein ACHAXR_009882 [Thalassiosira sp. AJA248-18]